MKLSINATSNTQLILELDSTQKTVRYDSPRDQDTLLAIKTFLDEEEIRKSDLTEIYVHTGPGNFTSLRTSIATAQALSLSLQIPINGLPPGSSVEAEYGSPPSITSRKS